MRENISLAEAIGILADLLPSALATERLPLASALGRTLAHDLASLADHPSLDDSALDGFAVRQSDCQHASPEQPVLLRVVGVAPAGGPWAGLLGPGEALRIFTGGAVPAGADGIVMVEHSQKVEASPTEQPTILPPASEQVAILPPASEQVAILPPASEQVAILRPATADIRQRGQDLRTGQVYLQAGQLLGPQHLALAAAMGHGHLPVQRRLRVAVVSTGDEVVAPGLPLPLGAVYNTVAGLVAALEVAGCQPLLLAHVPDQSQQLEATLTALLASDQRPDLILTVGGVSMGERDIVRHWLEAAASAGQAQLHFWRIRLKPGGPALCASWQGIPVLGLPGNPVSSLVVFQVLAKAAIHQALGRLGPTQQVVWARASTAFRATAGKLGLQRASLTWQEQTAIVAGFANQSSGVLRSLVASNALVVVPPGQDIAVGEMVEVWLL
jgi:molybdopterin molybdotransferase